MSCTLISLSVPGERREYWHSGIGRRRAPQLMLHVRAIVFSEATGVIGLAVTSVAIGYHW